nr:hydrogenase subunit MbhD domain-containing protein [Halomonas kenyensis]
MAQWSFDLLLAGGLLWLGWQALFEKRRFSAVVHFMAFNLLMALVWVRLSAPDIALAEAAIGAGVTGALLLTALGRLPSGTSSGAHPHRWHPHWRYLAVISACISTAWLIAVVPQLPSPGLAGEIEAVMPATGVDHAVTAVLLNIRALDTLLEVAVMLAAVVLVWSLGPTLRPLPPATILPGLPALSRLLHPLFLLVPTYLLWRGTHAPGGAFPAGAVLGAGGVLMLLADEVGWMQRQHWQRLLRLLLVSGLALFVLVGLGGLLMTGTFLSIPLGVARLLIMAVEIAMALSIALMLMALYLYGEPGQ